ncbi:MAG: spore germination protein [Erysipelotrichaceae bacterium]|nr:spore germination protein [Erysipelotrichaceae bacterium]
MLKEFIDSQKNRVDLVYDKINDIEFIYLKNGILSELWIRDFLPKIIEKDFTSLYSGLFKRLTFQTFDDYNRLLSNGAVLVLVDNDAYACYLNFPPKRGLTDSLCDPSNLFGSRDGFNEIIADNRILIRKRIKTNDLIFDELFMGDKTECEINLVYLKKNKYIAETIKNKLYLHKNHNIVSVLDLNSILTKELLVPNFVFTGNPETCVNSILKDKVIILIDNSPIAVIIPSSLFELTENSNETNGFTYSTIFNRIFVLIFLFLTIFLVGLFVLLTSHHPEALSVPFITNFQISERGTTFPLIIEIIIVLILFEAYRQLASRSPLSFVQNIIIIFGGLFIGQNALDAGLIGSSAIIIASLSYVSSFAVTNNSYLVTSFSIFRVFILIMSYVLGMIGFLVSSIIIISYLANIKVFNRYYLEPIIPLNLRKFKGWLMPKKE